MRNDEDDVPYGIAYQITLDVSRHFGGLFSRDHWFNKYEALTTRNIKRVLDSGSITSKTNLPPEVHVHQQNKQLENLRNDWLI